MKKLETTCDCNSIQKDLVEEVKKILPDPLQFYVVGTFFKVLGDPTRAKIIWSLEQSDLCVCDIANVLNMSKSSVSHQLKTLREAGFVTYQKKGKTVYYKLADDHVRNLFLLGMEHINHKT